MICLFCVFFFGMYWPGEIKKIMEKHITRARFYLPKKRVAFKGVPLEGCTWANHEGTSRALPRTQRYLAWPNMATMREATSPKLAPAPTTLPAHFHPIFWKAFENDASFDIYKKQAYKLECDLRRLWIKYDLYLRNNYLVFLE